KERQAGELAWALGQVKTEQQKTAAALQQVTGLQAKTKEALDDAQRNLGNSFLLLAENAWNLSGTAELAQDYLDQVPPGCRRWGWRLLKANPGAGLFAVRGPRRAGPGGAGSPEGPRLASASFDGTVRVWEVATGKVLLTLKGHTGDVWAVAWSADGT